MLENATRICDAKFGIMTLYEGGSFRAVALHNAPPEFAEARRREPLFSPAPNNPLARVAATKKTLQIPDIRQDECYLSGEQATVIIAERGGARTLIDIPMLKDGELVGVFGIYRQEVRRSPTSRSSCCRTSPPRPSSPSRTRGCSTNCASVPTISPSCWSSRQ